MTKQIQNADASERLREQFDLKGRVSASLDELIVPVTDVGDFAGKSPYEADTRLYGGGAARQAAAGAGRIGYVCITPGAGTLLVVERVFFTNSAANQVYDIRLQAPTEVVGTTTGTANAPCWNQPMQPVALKRLMRATTRTIHHTVITGLQIQNWSVFNGFAPIELDLGRGIVLDGSAQTGALSLAIWHPTANVATCWINWSGSEYTVR